MGRVACQRQELNVYRIEDARRGRSSRLYAGQKTLKASPSTKPARLRDEHPHTHYLLGTAYGATSVSSIGAGIFSASSRRSPCADFWKRKASADILIGLRRRRLELPSAFLLSALDDKSVKLVGVRRRTPHQAEQHARAVSRRLARPCAGHAPATILQDRIRPDPITHSVSAGLDYAAVGPEHARGLRGRQPAPNTPTQPTQGARSVHETRRGWNRHHPALETRPRRGRVHGGARRSCGQGTRSSL